MLVYKTSTRRTVCRTNAKPDKRLEFELVCSFNSLDINANLKRERDTVILI